MDARKDLNFTFAYRYQPSLTLAPRARLPTSSSGSRRRLGVDR